MSVTAEREQHKDDCVKESLIAGAKASAWALASSSLLVGLANQFLPSFRSSLGVSGKTALIVSLFTVVLGPGAICGQGSRMAQCHNNDSVELKAYMTISIRLVIRGKSHFSNCIGLKTTSAVWRGASQRKYLQLRRNSMTIYKRQEGLCTAPQIAAQHQVVILKVMEHLFAKRLPLANQPYFPVGISCLWLLFSTIGAHNERMRAETQVE